MLATALICYFSHKMPFFSEGQKNSYCLQIGNKIPRELSLLNIVFYLALCLFSFLDYLPTQFCYQHLTKVTHCTRAVNQIRAQEMAWTNHVPIYARKTTVWCLPSNWWCIYEFQFSKVFQPKTLTKKNQTVTLNKTNVQSFSNTFL